MKDEKQNNQQIMKKIDWYADKFRHDSSKNISTDNNHLDDFFETELELFVNYDICNFTSYKNENPDWINLLQAFIKFATDETKNFPPNFPLQFWKFSGDAITFRKGISSVYEIAKTVDLANKLLVQMQDELNRVGFRTNSRIFIKAAIWIAKFEGEKSTFNNVKLKKSQFGQEFVGKNIDEGFRLCSCSSADTLVVDPKIVHIINLYSHVIDNKEGNDTLITKLSNINDNWKKIIDNIKLDVHVTNEKTTYEKKFIQDMNECFYFVGFHKCKGVWSDRDYPIFWYIEDLNKKNFIYDEEIDESIKLRDHPIYELYRLYNDSDRELKEVENKINELIRHFRFKKTELVSIFESVRVTDSIYKMLESLCLNAEISRFQVYNTANLYYMVANVVIKDGKDLGILIFKRKEIGRKHLKNVWDLIPVKHAPIPMLKLFLESNVRKILNFQNLNCKIVPDEIRNSIVPVSLCNVYRNKVVHNGVLCVSEVDISSYDDIVSFMKTLKSNLDDTGYCDARLVTLDNIIEKEDCIQLEDGLKIRSLTPNEISDDSNEVSQNTSFVTKFDVLHDETGHGISFLSSSIKQILDGRINGMYKIT